MQPRHLPSSVDSDPKRSLRNCQQGFWRRIEHNHLESGFLRDHTVANEAAGAGDSATSANSRRRLARHDRRIAPQIGHRLPLRCQFRL
jgi:hypothetical protein